jgi:hypothetical protein
MFPFLHGPSIDTYGNSMRRFVCAAFSAMYSFDPHKKVPSSTYRPLLWNESPPHPPLSQSRAILRYVPSLSSLYNVFCRSGTPFSVSCPDTSRRRHPHHSHSRGTLENTKVSTLSTYWRIPFGLSFTFYCFKSCPRDTLSWYVRLNHAYIKAIVTRNPLPRLTAIHPLLFYPSPPLFLSTRRPFSNRHGRTAPLLPHTLA